jgi:alanine dehydrogenase
MKIGVPREKKSEEYRVSITPYGAYELIKEGHTVFVEDNAGIHAGFKNEDYVNVGCKILDSEEKIFTHAELIVKVKEPQLDEIKYLNKNHVLFCYLHLASSDELTEKLRKTGALCLAYETLQERNHSLPLLIPMSEIAGRLSVQKGAWFLEKNNGGKGKLVSGATGVEKCNVVILGGGTVGYNAAHVAAGMGAAVTIFELNLARIRFLEEVLPKNVQCLYASSHYINKYIAQCDLLIGAILVPGKKTPKIITKEHLKIMEPRSVFVDVAIDQGGIAETSKPTTHKEPIFIEHNILHYCVTNMPAAVPITSTLALTQATLPYIKKLAHVECKIDKILNDEILRTAVNIYNYEVLVDIS